MSFQNGAELQNSSVNNTATEQISHQHQQKSLAKPGFIAAVGRLLHKIPVLGLQNPSSTLNNIKIMIFSNCKDMLIIKLTLKSQEVLSRERGSRTSIFTEPH